MRKRRFNTIKRWPYTHICYLSLECWMEMYLYGMPMRVHFKDRYWTVPGPVKWYSDHRHQVMWSEAVVVQTRGPAAEDDSGRVGSEGPSQPL